MADDYGIEKKFYYLGETLVNKIIEASEIKTFGSGVQLIREGQYIKVIPIVLNGLVKVFTRIEEKELLLYYIKPEQSCIMSFSSAINNDKSKIFALTEQESTLLFIPSDKVAKWITEFPIINTLFYQQYDLRYAELIDTINHLIYHKLDRRILDYLIHKVRFTGKNPLKISHKEIANDLGTAREVVSRLVKKLENEHLLKQYPDSIELFMAK
jgi:CRP/FNR family transcriptional regulator